MHTKATSDNEAQAPLTNNVGELAHSLPKQLYCELNLSRCGCCRLQLAGDTSGPPSRIENVGVVRSDRHGKVCAIENVEKLGPELHVKVFRHPSNTIVLKDRKVEIREAWSNHDIAPGIATQIGALRVRKALIAICIVEMLARGRWYRETFALDVIVRIPGIDQRLTTRTGETVRKGLRIAAIEALRIAIGSPCSTERHAIIRLVDRT